MDWQNSLQKNESESGQSDELPSFWDMLKQCDLLRQGDPETITTGKPPYRLQYPLEGFTSLHETKKPPAVRRASVPAVLDVKLQSRSTEPSRPAPTESKAKPPHARPTAPPAPAPAPSAAPEQTNGTVVKLPPKKKPSEDSTRVDNFLKKIPNLSFMLSPKLSLPAEF